jgi:Arc/MetJ-type ribon-helix-helix transcriptional regulator
MTTKGYRCVSLPKNLVDAVEELVKEGKYSSNSQFVGEAVRLRLEELQRAKEA